MNDPKYIFTTFVFYAAFSIFADGLNLFLVLRQKPTSVRKTLLWAVFVHLGWAISSAMLYSATDLADKLLWHKLYLSFFSVVPVFIAITMLQLGQVNHFLTKKWIAAYFLIPAISIILIFTNDYHYLVWKPDPNFNVQLNLIEFFYWRWYYSGILLMIYVEMLFGVFAMFVIRKNFLVNVKTQFVLISVGFFTPLMGELVYFYGQFYIPGYDPIVGLFSITIGLLTLSIYAFTLISTVPVQIDQIMNLLPQAIFVVDMENVLLFQNSKAIDLFELHGTDHNLFPISQKNIIGNKFMIPSNNYTVEVLIEQTREKRLLRKTEKVIINNSEEVAGRIVIISDLTDQRAQFDVEKQDRLLEEKEKFYKGFSTDFSEFFSILDRDLREMKATGNTVTRRKNDVIIDHLLAAVAAQQEKFDHTLLEREFGSAAQITMSERLKAYLNRLNAESEINITYSMPAIEMDPFVDKDIFQTLIDTISTTINYAQMEGSATQAHIVFVTESDALSVIYFDDCSSPIQKVIDPTKEVNWNTKPKIENRPSITGSNLVIHFSKPKQNKEIGWNLTGKRILIADRETLFSSTVGSYFRSVGMFYLGNIPNYEKILTGIKTLRPDILLLSTDWPTQLILDAITQINAGEGDVNIVMVGYDISDELLITLHNEIQGFVAKDQTIEDLLEGLSRIMVGETVYSPLVMGRIMNMDLQHPNAGVNKAISLIRAKGVKEKQIKILRAIINGANYKEIALEMNMSESAIKYHAGELIKNLGVKSKAELISYCNQIGFS